MVFSPEYLSNGNHPSDPSSVILPSAEAEAALAGTPPATVRHPTEETAKETNTASAAQTLEVLLQCHLVPHKGLYIPKTSDGMNFLHNLPFRGKPSEHR